MRCKSAPYTNGVTGKLDAGETVFICNEAAGPWAARLNRVLPLKAERKYARPEQKMQHSSAATARGFGGGMQQQRAHGHRAALPGRANHFDPGITGRGGCLRLHLPVQVRARDDPQRAVFCAASVDVQAHRHQLPQQLGRRLDIQTAFLLGPAAQAGMLHAGRHRDAQVLVHRHQPVAGCRFFKKSTLHCGEIGRDQRRQRRVSADFFRKRMAPGLRQQATCSRRIRGNSCNPGRGGFALGRAQHLG